MKGIVASKISLYAMLPKRRVPQRGSSHTASDACIFALYTFHEIIKTKNKVTNDKKSHVKITKIPKSYDLYKRCGSEPARSQPEQAQLLVATCRHSFVLNQRMRKYFVAF